MNKNKKTLQNPEFEVNFIQQQKLREQMQLQNKLHLQILRVKSSQKQGHIYHVTKMDRDQLCQFFAEYQMFPQVQFTLQELKQKEGVKLIRNKGKIYFGQVKNKQMSGKGICFYPEGKLYQGTFINNKKEGIGCQIYQNGNLYVGEFSNNKKNGVGQFFWFSQSDEQNYQYYDGEWWGGLPDGKGTHKKRNGDFYQGTFKNGLKHGFGSEYYGNGDIYKGQFINGLPEGIGSYFWKDGSFYKGDFKQGLRNGYGIWKMNQNSCQRYEGHYLMDKKQGYGQYTWSNGWVYKGNFQNDKRQGYGQLYDYNACVFKGQWSRGQKLEQLPNNIVKISRVLQKHNIRCVERQQIQIQDIVNTINIQPRQHLMDINKQHQLLTRPGFLVRRPTKGSSININKHKSRDKHRNEKSPQIQIQQTLTSRVGTTINRPISKSSLKPQTARKLGKKY